MQYLRARYYDVASGTFNRLDPFSGNMQDPQSLHKYLYVHGDPIQGIDPTGLAEFTIAGVTVNITLPSARTFQSYSALKAYTSVLAFEITTQVGQLLYLYEIFDFTLTLIIMGIDAIPDSYANPNHGTNAPVEEYEVGEYQDLYSRAQANGQGSELRIHHAPQKAVAASTIPGYQPPPSPNEPCIAVPVEEHSNITSAQFSNAKDRFRSPPTQEDLVARDMFHIRKYTGAPVSNLKNLAGMIRGRYPSLFRRFRR